MKMLGGEAKKKKKKEKRIKIEGAGGESVEEMLRYIYGAMPDFNTLDVSILCDLFQLAHM